MNSYDDEIAKLRALGPERVDALAEEVLAGMDTWLRDLLTSTDPYKSRILRANVLSRSRLRHAPPATDDPQLRLAPSDESSPEPSAAAATRRATLVRRPKIDVLL